MAQFIVIALRCNLLFNLQLPTCNFLTCNLQLKRANVQTCIVRIAGLHDLGTHFKNLKKRIPVKQKQGVQERLQKFGKPQQKCGRKVAVILDYP